MSHSTHTGQSKFALVASTLFMAALCAFSAFLFFNGPNPDSVFAFYRSGFLVRTAGALGAIFFLGLTLVGIKRPRSKQH